MEKLDLNSLTKEQIALASKCQTPEELIKLAKEAGIELTIEQAQAYLDELENMELDKAELENVAGGHGSPLGLKGAGKKISSGLYGNR